MTMLGIAIINKTNDLILNLTPENVTQHSRIVTTTHKGSSTPTKMSKIIGITIEGTQTLKIRNKTMQITQRLGNQQFIHKQALEGCKK